MYVTNLTPSRLGISGPIVLSPQEQNRYLDESNPRIMAAVMRLKAGNFVSYTLDAGITKTVPAMAVKTLAVDVSVIGNEPKVIKAPKAKVEEPKETKVEAEPVAKKKTAKQTVTKVENNVAEVEATAEEVAEAESDTGATSNKKSKKAKKNV